jgi:hypothetical protein
MPDGGYQTESESMARAQTQLSQATEDTSARADKVTPSEVTQKDFGRVHGEHFNGYKSGIDTIAAAMKGLAGAINSLGGGIGTADTQYSSNEQAQGATANKAGNS